MDAGFFRGTSADQDNRFVNKQKKLMKSMKFAENIDAKVDMKKVNLETLKPWIHERVTDMLTFEDDVVVAYIYNSLEEQFPDPKTLQINLTGFLNGKNSRMFMGELWKLLISAQQSPHGIPEELINQKKEDIRKRQIEVEKIAELKNLLPKIEVKEEPREVERSARRRRRSRSTSRDNRHRRSRSRENRHRRSRSRDRRRSSRDRYTSSSRHRSTRRRRRSESRERVTSRSRHNDKRRHDDRVSKDDAKRGDETRKDSLSDARHHGNSGSRKYGLNVSKASAGDDKVTSQKENGDKKSSSRDYDACPVDPWARAPRHGQTSENRGRHATDAPAARSKKVEKAPISDGEEKWEEKKTHEKSKRVSSSVSSSSSSDQNSDVEERRRRKRKTSKTKERKSKKIRVQPPSQPDSDSSSSEEQVAVKPSKKKISDKPKRDSSGNRSSEKPKKNGGDEDDEWCEKSPPPALRSVAKQPSSSSSSSSSSDEGSSASSMSEPEKALRRRALASMKQKH